MTTLSDILDSLSLSSHLSTFEEEELTLETLTWMSKDDPKEFLSSMEELGLSASDATKLLSKLSPPAEANLPDEDFLGLIGLRSLITGLKSRPELNGRVCIAKSLDSSNGRYTVTTESEPFVTVALKAVNLDAEGARAIPIPRKKSESEDAAHNRRDNDGDMPFRAIDQPHMSGTDKPVIDVSDSSGVAQSDTTIESDERTAAYLAASKWGKNRPVDPRSAEAFYKKKNREKREEEEAALDAWKRANPEEAAKLAAAKERARQTVGYSLNAQRTVTPSGVKKSHQPPQQSSSSKEWWEEEDDEDGESASSTAPVVETKPKATAKDKDSPELAAALAALRSAAVPATPGATSAAMPSANLLAATLSKAGAAVPAVPSMPAPTGKPPPTMHHVAPPSGLGGGGGIGGGGVEDLLAAALAKTGVLVDPTAKKPTVLERGGGAGGAGALDAYKKRQAHAGDAKEGDVGTIDSALQAKRDFHEARAAEAKYRDKHAFVGKHYNDI